MSPESDQIRLEQILRSLLAGRAKLVRNAMQADWPAHRNGNERTRPLFWVNRVDAELLLERGALEVSENGLSLTPATRRRLTGEEVAEEADAPYTPPSPSVTRANMRGSTILRLSRRRTRTRKPLLTERQVATAERYARDAVRAGEGGPNASDPSAPQVDGTRRHDAAERAMLDRIDAGRAINAAKEAVGPDMARLLDYVCVSDRKLETVEADEGWPAGMALHMLRMALDRLAIHYGGKPETKRATRRPDVSPQSNPRYFRQG